MAEKRLASLEIADALRKLHWLIQYAPGGRLDLEVNAENRASPTRRMHIRMFGGTAKISILNNRGTPEVVLHYEMTPNEQWREVRVIFGGDDE